jgi:hypothetical protein
MEFFQTNELAVPLVQMLLLLGLSTVCLFLRRVKLGLLINYLFALYWGFLCNQEFLASHTSDGVLLPILYFGVGIALVVIAVISFFSEGK